MIGVHSNFELRMYYWHHVQTQNTTVRISLCRLPNSLQKKIPFPITVSEWVEALQLTGHIWQ